MAVTRRAIARHRRIWPVVARSAAVDLDRAVFLPMAPEKLRPHDHAGVEFIYVINGILSLHINSEEHALTAGDAIDFDATLPHGYRRRGGRLCSAVVVTASWR
jgi:mannose-6-phosphate isomerase-like protein (cupin superfamily)